MDDKSSHNVEELDDTSKAITELLFRQNIYPESTAERLAITAAATGQAIWLASDEPTSLMDDVKTRADFIHKILLPVYRYRQNNQDIATLYQWTNYHGPFTSREMELIETTMTLDKSQNFAEQMRPANQTSDNKIRGAYLEALLLALAELKRQSAISARHGLTIAGSAIEGRFDLSYQQDLPPLAFICCSFEKTIILNHASLKELQLTGSQCPGLEATGIRTKGALDLDGGFSALGPVTLTSAYIGGHMDASGGQFRSIDPPTEEPALSLERTEINNDLIFGEDFSADGTINANGMICHLNFLVQGARLTNQAANLDDNALICHNAEILGSCQIENNSAVIGTIDLKGCLIKGNLEISSSTLQHPINGSTTNALTLTNCRIGGQLHLTYSAISGRSAFDNCAIAGGCKISSITADNKSGIPASTTLSFQHCKLGDSLTVEESSIKGRSLISGCSIGTSLTITNTELDNQVESNKGMTLTLEKLTLGSQLSLGPGLISKGPVEIKNNRIHADLSLAGSRYDGDVIISQSRIENDLILDTPAASGETATQYGGRLLLLNSQAGTLRDTEASWPEQIFQRNFQYQRLSKQAPSQAAKRLTWLNRNPEFSASSYKSAIHSLYRSGNDREARQIAIAYADKTFWRQYHTLAEQPGLSGKAPAPLVKNLRYGVLTPFFAVIWLFYGAMIKYGYGYSRLIILFLAAFILTAALVQRAEQQNLFMPQSPEIALHQAYASCTPERGGKWTACNVTEIPPFKPLLYSLDLMLPIIDLQQAENWRPRNESLILTLPAPRCWQLTATCQGLRWLPITTGKGFTQGTLLLTGIFAWLLLIGALLVFFNKGLSKWQQGEPTNI